MKIKYINIIDSIIPNLNEVAIWEDNGKYYKQSCYDCNPIELTKEQYDLSLKTYPIVRESEEKKGAKKNE